LGYQESAWFFFVDLDFEDLLGVICDNFLFDSMPDRIRVVLGAPLPWRGSGLNI